MLANAEARDRGRNRLEFAAITRRRVGLQVPCVLMSRTTPHKQQDARFRFAAGCRLIGAQHVRQRETEKTERAGAQDLAAAHGGGGEETRASRRLHRCSRTVSEPLSL